MKDFQIAQMTIVSRTHKPMWRTLRIENRNLALHQGEVQKSADKLKEESVQK
jgi:hypothetical protein